MKIGNRNLGYSLIQVFYWVGYACVMGFASMYLLQAGFDNGQVGLLIAAAGALSALLQPVVAAYADRPGSMPLKWLVFLVTAAYLLCAAILAVAGDSRMIVGGCYGCCMVLLQLTTPLLNALGVATVNAGESLNYGAARGLGSLGYGAAAYGVGALAAALGAKVVPVCMAAGAAALLMATGCYRKLPPVHTAAVPQAGKQSGFLQRYPRFMVVLAGLTLLFVSHTVLNSFTYQIVVSKGGDSSQMGTAIALASLAELPAMFLFGWMNRKLRCDIWFRLSGVFFLLKTLGSLLSPNIPLFYAAQIFQMGGFALITVSSVFYIDAIVAPEDSVKGQACFTLTMTLGSVLGAIAAGEILDRSGVRSMLLFATVCAFLGAAITMVFTQKVEEKR